MGGQSKSTTPRNSLERACGETTLVNGSQAELLRLLRRSLCSRLLIEHFNLASL